MPDSTPLEPRHRRQLRRQLLRWYALHARDLPWRGTTDPYRIWISEIMLQQTTVAAVVPYFHRFVERFPDVHALADAPEADVLRLWEGLGYYSRARNIHRSAQEVSRVRGGRFPACVEELQTLPGIGRYTAGAIASFAFDLPAPIVEANTLRLYSRLIGFRGDPRSTPGQRTLWEFAASIVPPREPGRFNQALMELGATVCTPRDPACPACPLQSVCRAFLAGLQAEIPPPKAQPEVTAVVEAAVGIRRNGRYLLRQCGPDERWAGLWDFPRFAIDESAAAALRPGGLFDGGPELERLLADGVARLTGLSLRAPRLVTEIRHSVTRYRIRLLCVVGETDGGRPQSQTALRWLRPADLASVPLSTTGRKLARLLAKRPADVM